VLTLPEMICEFGTASRLPHADRREATFHVVTRLFAYHFELNELYRNLCNEAGVEPSMIASPSDLGSIPLLPVRLFKEPNAHALLSRPVEQLELEIRSTGTSGVPSVARRDAGTTTAVALALIAQYREFFGISGGTGLFLCPSPAENPEMGLAKVFNLFCGLLDESHYALRGYTFRPEEAAGYLAGRQGSSLRHIFGPPFLVNRLLDHVQSNGIDVKLDEDSLVVMLGGWKRYTGKTIDERRFRAKSADVLSISPANVRDMYGLIESDMLAIECEQHRKHVPPWCHMSVRDAGDPAKEVPNGARGVIAILDGLNTSYPAFILTEDVGVLTEGECGCGRRGQMVAFSHRLKEAEVGCCAVNIERQLDTWGAAGAERPPVRPPEAGTEPSLPSG
jgi:long-chain-fatty-acid---luciferin-component ligase